MRLKLTLHTARGNEIALNYNYALSSAIYKLLHLGSPQFASFLHDIGFSIDGKTYKLFTFALKFEQFKIYSNSIILHSNKCYLYISSPIIDEFVSNLITGSFIENKISIESMGITALLNINQIESMPEPLFQAQNHIKLLSPLVLSTKRQVGDKVTQHYYRHDDDTDEINRVFNQNLKNKYRLLHRSEYEGDDLILTWDSDYISKRTNNSKRLTKKISIYKFGVRPVEIIANEVPFLLTGSPELIKIGYDCGFGEKNSMGFGLGELVK